MCLKQDYKQSATFNQQPLNKASLYAYLISFTFIFDDNGGGGDVFCCLIVCLFFLPKEQDKNDIKRHRGQHLQSVTNLIFHISILRII